MSMNRLQESPVRRFGLAEQVASVLIRRIIGDGLTAGSLLPTERELVQEFSVGKSAVREAIRIVSTKGLVDVVQGSRMRVAPYSRWNLIDAELVQGIGGTLLTMNQLLEVRKSVEPDVAAWAASRATDEVVASLQDIVAATISGVGSKADYVANDLAFHDALAAATRNPLYPLILGSLTALLEESRRGLVQSPGARDRGIYHHERILEAVRARDATVARDRMLEHLDQVASDWQLPGVIGPDVVLGAQTIVDPSTDPPTPRSR